MKEEYDDEAEDMTETAEEEYYGAEEEEDDPLTKSLKEEAERLNENAD